MTSPSFCGVELFAIRKSMEGQRKNFGMQPAWIREEADLGFKRAVWKHLKADRSNALGVFNLRVIIATLPKDDVTTVYRHLLPQKSRQADNNYTAGIKTTDPEIRFKAKGWRVW